MFQNFQRGDDVETRLPAREIFGTTCVIGDRQTALRSMLLRGLYRLCRGVQSRHLGTKPRQRFG